MKITIKVDKDFAYPGYIYCQQFYKEISYPMDFEGKSLEEIKKDYGNEIAKIVYEEACRGRDLTRPKIYENVLTSNSLVDLSIEKDQLNTIRVSLMANPFTLAKSDMVFITFQDLEVLSNMDLIVEGIIDAIKSMKG